MIIRRPAVAGSFYPQDSNQLQDNIEQLLIQAAKPSLHPKALIAPHAGYIYSGPIAATAYNTLADIADNVTRVVILGPSHRIPLQAIATPGCHFFQTPLGQVPIDTAAIEHIHALDGVVTSPEAHAREHSLEVHLPFLQRVLGDFSLVPLVVGNVYPEKVAAVLDSLWGGSETLIVVSSDLSHYHPYAEANKLDRATTADIEKFTTQLHGDQACGCNAINGLLYAAKQRGLALTTLDVRNSGDTAGDRHRVVGYGAYALH